MSWYENDKHLKAKSRTMLRIFGFSLLLLTAVGLSGCSFQPLYGTTASGNQLSEELKSVSIATIPGRVGQRVRNELIYQTTNGGAPLPPLYKLEIALNESDVATLVRTTGDAQGQIYRLKADFKLVRLRDKKVIFTGASHARAAYDKSFIFKKEEQQGNPPQTVIVEKQVGSGFGDIRARINAENRASKILAEEIKTRIAAHLATAG